MMAMDTDAELLTVAQAAQALKISTVTVHRWLKQGRLSAFHVGPRAVRIRRDDLAQVVRPMRREEAPEMNDRLTTVLSDIRPLTDADRKRALAALADARALGEVILARTGGIVLAESWPIINEARDERSTGR